MDAALRILMMIVTVAVILFCLVYARLDRENYRCLSLAREMEDDLRKWIAAGGELVAAEPVRAEDAEAFEALTAELDAVKKGKHLDKIRVVNRIAPVVWSAAVEKSDTFAGARKVRELNDIAESLAGLNEAYDLSVGKLAARLDGGLTGLVARICRMKPAERLAELRIPEIRGR